MQSSSALLFRSLASKIHPPLPLSHRESQQLLQILTSSFQKHLDRNHPISAPEEEDGSRPRVKVAPTVANCQSTSRQSSHHLADHHIKSLLTNPLFSTQPARSTASGKRERDAHELHQLKNDPLRWLQQHFASGLESLERVRRALGSIWRLDDPKAYVLKTQAASKILEWVDASARLDRNQLGSDLLTRNSLCKALVAEERTDLIWHWASLTTIPDIHKRRLLVSYSKATIRDAQKYSLDPAIEIISVAISKGFRPVDVHYLSQWIVRCILNGHDRIEISLDHYNRFLRALPDWSRRLAFDRAVLGLFHPALPSKKETIRYFNVFSSSYDPGRPLSAGHSRDHVALFLNLARSLFEERDYNTASTIIDFVKQQFPREVGLGNEIPNNVLKTENLQHFQALALG